MPDYDEPVPNSAMMLLLSIHLDRKLDVRDGKLVLLKPDGGTYNVIEGLDDALSILELREWVAINGDDVATTDKGRYWLKRWVDIRFGRSTLRRLAQMDAITA